MYASNINFLTNAPDQSIIKLNVPKEGRTILDVHDFCSVQQLIGNREVEIFDFEMSALFTRRKVGGEDLMQACEPFSTQIECLKFVGFNREASKRFPKLFRLFQCLDIYFVLFAFLGECFFIAKNFDDVLASAECFGPLATMIIVLPKFLTYIIYEEKFYKLMDTIKALAVTDSKIFAKAVGFEKAVALTYLASASLTGFVLCIAPLMVELTNAWIYGSEFKREIPYKSLFPYATDVSPNYEITFLMFVGATHVTVIQSVSSTKRFDWEV